MFLFFSYSVYQGLLVLLTIAQEGYLAQHAVSDEDRMVATQANELDDDGPVDPMQGLEGLDVAGPRQA